MNKKLLGIIGGMGAQASADFYNTIIRFTDAPKDQDHIEILLYSKASIPDRTEAIVCGDKAEVVASLQKAYDKLLRAGADYIVMTCNTAHYFLSDINANEKAPFISLIDETIHYIQSQNISKVGLMTTDGTSKSKIYEKPLLDVGIEVIKPSEDKQKQLMNFIYNQIKSGKEPDRTIFGDVANSLISQNVDGIILGCTELSYYANLASLDNFYINPQEILAKKCILQCGGKLKEVIHE